MLGMQVQGRVLPDTFLQYANRCGVAGNNQGQWRPGGPATLIDPAGLRSWAVLNMAPQRCSSQGISEFVSHLRSEMVRQGMRADAPATIQDGSRYGSVEAALEDIMQQGKGGAAMQLVLVVLPAKGSVLYRQVKEAAAQLGLVTQCVVAPQAKISGGTASKDVPYLNNLLLKINAKLVRGAAEMDTKKLKFKMLQY